MPLAHILTDIDPRLFLKQTPNKRPTFDGVDFTFGLDVDPTADMLITYTRASWSVPTTLPKHRTAFVAGEPEDIHPYSAGFLNQFGTVVAPGDKSLKTNRLEHNYCLIWFVGVDFQNLDAALGYDHFHALPAPPKDNKISIVTSTKASTEYHRKRLKFIDILKEKIPDQITLYGRGFNPIDDKMDALLPHKYHLALENGAGRYTWTEKLSDPLLCWSLPFYAGCENVHDELPSDSIIPINLDDPDAAIAAMMHARDHDLWTTRKPAIAEARSRLLHQFNLMGLFARLTRDAVAKPANPTKRMIYAERSLNPETGARGSIPEMLIRRTLLAVDPKIELRLGAAKMRRRANR